MADCNCAASRVLHERNCPCATPTPPSASEPTGRGEDVPQMSEKGVSISDKTGAVWKADGGDGEEAEQEGGGGAEAERGARVAGEVQGEPVAHERHVGTAGEALDREHLRDHVERVPDCGDRREDGEQAPAVRRVDRATGRILGHPACVARPLSLN